MVVLYRWRLVRVCVHGCDPGIVLLRHEVAVLGEAGRPLEHMNTGVRRLLLLLRVDGRLVIWNTVVLMGAAG